VADVLPAYRHFASRDLCGRAIDAGWAVLWKPQEDTGGNPFIVVEGMSGDRWFSAAWHTRDTGSYRFWQGSVGSKHRPRTVSLKRLIEYVEGVSSVG
jgi:hypothetical protein